MLALDDFRGAWGVARRIDDRLTGQTGRFEGEAVFSDQAGGLIYVETGQMRLGEGPPMTATRRYLWDAGAGQINVRFADGAPFHSFVPRGAGAGTDHPCGDDFYKVQYDFRGWPEWQAVWTVVGPRKDYTSITDYRRGD